MQASLEARSGYHERTALLGMIIFIASWAMLFAGLFFAYGLLRLRAPAWPPADLPRIPTTLPALATAVLALSSLALVRGRGRRRSPAIAAVLGAGFLALQITVWRDLASAGLLPQAGPFASAFFGLTVFHALHVAVGLVALTVLAARPAPVALRLWTLYWHMVGIVWGIIYLLVYLL